MQLVLFVIAVALASAPAAPAARASVPERHAGPAAAPADTAPPAPDTGTYYLTRLDEVMARERFARSDSLLQAWLLFADQPPLELRASLRPDATIRRLELRVRSPEAGDTTLVQSSAAAFVDDAVYLEQPIGTPAADTVPVPPGTLPFVNPSPSFIEQVVRRARAVGGDVATVSLWLPDAGGGHVVAARVEFQAAGRVTLDLEGTVVEIALDSRGGILAGFIPSEGIGIQRVRQPE